MWNIAVKGINEVGRWGEKGVCFGEKVRGLQGEAGAIRGDGRVCRRAAGGVFRQMGYGAQAERECAAKGGFVLTVQR